MKNITDKYQFTCPYCGKTFEPNKPPKDQRIDFSGPRSMFCTHCKKRMALHFDEKTDTLTALKLEMPVQEETHEPTAVGVLEKTRILYERDRAKKPWKIRDSVDYECPTCRGKVGWALATYCGDAGENAFCPHCGQRLDWSDTK